MKRLFLIVLLSVASLSQSLKILALFPYGGKSHVDVFLPLTKALAQKGHQVTVIGHFPLEKPIPHYTDINLRGQQFVEFFNLEFRTSKKSMFLTPLLLNDMSQFFCTSNFKSPELKEFLETNQTFDVIILEAFNSDCFAGIVHKIGAPLIGISSSTIMPWINERLGNPTHPAYIPNNFFDFSDKMTFYERLINLGAEVIQNNYYYYWMLQNDYEISKNYFNNLPPLKNIVHNSSLLLVNSHFSYNLPRPLVPAVIEVGGIHIGKVKKLPNVSNNQKNNLSHSKLCCK